MDPRKLFVDERLRGFCVYCRNNNPTTRDHVPSRVLLDEPLPPQLPVVEACSDCNAGFSQDEQYFACLIECAISGTTNPEDITRDKIKRILIENPKLKNRIDNSRILDETENIFWKIEPERFKKIILKLAQGHLAYELNIFPNTEPDECSFVPLALMSDEEFLAFNAVPESELLPELGSRAFMNIFVKNQTPNHIWQNWKTIQENRYRYRVDQSNGSLVKFVLSEYLACTVIWA